MLTEEEREPAGCARPALLFDTCYTADRLYGAPSLIMRLVHGYTNDSVLDGTIVTKHYRGLEARARQTREAAALQGLADYLPVPEVLHVDGAGLRLQTRYLPSRHGQELIDAGHALQVLRLCGELLRHLQALPVHLIVAEAAAGTVIVHGDFGPNNLLLTPDAGRIVALVDWEWVHVGQPIEDLAWAEWIVRTHHPQAVPALSALFAGYGARPPWPERQVAMLAQCRHLLQWVQRQAQPAGVRLWQARLQATEQFVELAA